MCDEQTRQLLELAKEHNRPPGSRLVLKQGTWFDKLCWIIQIPLRAAMCFSVIFIFFMTYFGFILPVSWAKHLWPRLYWFLEGKLYRWLQAFIGYWGYTAGYDIYEYGDDITTYYRDERVLVVCNHQSTADVPVLFSVLQSKGVAARKCLWLMDVMFRWTPFGIIGNSHGDYFIQQGKATREKQLDLLKSHLRNVFWDRDRRWVILFPEGGFYYKRVESSQRYGKQNGFPHLLYTTLPRTGAVKAILEEIGPRGDDDEYSRRERSSSKLKLLKDTVEAIREKKYVKETRPPIKYILDVTIAYPNGIPLSLVSLGFGTREKSDIAVNYKIYDIQEVGNFDLFKNLRFFLKCCDFCRKFPVENRKYGIFRGTV
ncbi:hypothetical protein WR25_20513 [Diploscapter pachys]|uniref:Phospholipid/glycerol acyltransferase domain-containing protein n=1 Tax=Diploscapter pachys TaxID=2018661 RepID=A0A2A2LS72_9BILA|nr:hypothetical protein WR25_20513 [Diploscapter pachys]